MRNEAEATGMCGPESEREVRQRSGKGGAGSVRGREDVWGVCVGVGVGVRAWKPQR